MVQTKDYKSPEISIVEIAGDQAFAVVAGSNFQSGLTCKVPCLSYPKIL